jgi:hypothetical protein
MDMINRAEIIVYQTINAWPYEYQKKAIEILENEFTLTPWEEIADIPQPQGIDRTILFRKKNSTSNGDSL